jgi:hypothetical protein
MASQEAVRKVVQQVRPILSVDSSEARKRVFNLYKAWYRQIPYVGRYSIYVKIKDIINAITTSTRRFSIYLDK